MRRVQLGDFRCCSPGQVVFAGLGEQFKAGVLQAPRQGEAGCALGDQRAMPRALTAGSLISGPVEGQRGRAEVAAGPSPLGLEQPQQVPEVHGRVLGASAQPPDEVIHLGQHRGTFISGTGSRVRGEGQAPQQSGHRAHVVAEDNRQRLHRRVGVACQGCRIVEDGGGDRAAEMSIERRCRVVGKPVDRHRVT